MTQRQIERLSGWMAFYLWLGVLGMFTIVGYQAVALSHEARPAPQPPIVAKVQKGKHAPKVQPQQPLSAQPQTDGEIKLQLLLGLTVLMIVAAGAATSWWTWRRRQRVRVEIRAEAYDGRRGRSRLRDSRAAGV